MTASLATSWTEEQLLDEFWKAVDQFADRLQLLRLFAMVFVAREPSWNTQAVRAEFTRTQPRPDRSALGCFSCYSRSRRLHRHHIVQVQHGGSNSVRNLVNVCDAVDESSRRGASCHQTVHLWMSPAVTSHETTHTQIDAYVAALGNALLWPYRRSAS